MSFAISGSILGLDKVIKAIDRLNTNMEKAALDSVKAAAVMVQSTAIKSIHAQGSGKLATRYSPKRIVRVSEPGQPPNSDTGALAQSIKFEIDEGKFRATIGTNLKYGAWLEFGTSEGLRARPWLAPAYAENADAIGKLFYSEMSKAIKRSGT